MKSIPQHITRPISHSDIVALLHTKHSEDVAVSECNTGSSTQDPNYQRIDFWAMKKSWARPTIFAYEIKTSRSDFLHDDKWMGYLKYCTDFYFIAPPDIIQVEELPPEAGLMVCSKNAKRLYTKKKAAHRLYADIGIPDRIYRYILFSRATIDVQGGGESGVEYYRKMLEAKDERMRVGEELAYKIKRLVDKGIQDIQSENGKLRREMQQYASFKEWLIGLGLKEEELSDYRSVAQLQGKLSRGMDQLYMAKGKINLAVKALHLAAEALQIEINDPAREGR